MRAVYAHGSTYARFGEAVGRMPPLVPAVLAAVFCACSTASVSVKSGYDFQHIHRVAVMGFGDFPRYGGSGDTVSSVFEKYLLQSGYDVIERRDVDKLLKEQSFSVTGAVDPKTAKKIGRILGVDALVLGNITAFSPEREETVMVDTHEDRQEPIVEKVTEQVKEGDQWVTTEKEVVTGYRRIHSSRRVPETRTIEAAVGIVARMVDVDTGQVLWIGSDSEQGPTLNDAADDASSAVFKALKKAFAKPRK